MSNNGETLYERLGGYEAIYVFAEDVMARMIDDDEVGVFWTYMSQDRVIKEHQHFVDFLAQHWGGPMTYRGRDMETIHKGMPISERHWELLFEKMDEAYEKFETPQDLREEVSTFLKGFKRQIVGSPSFREVVRGPDGKKFAGGMEADGVKWP